MAKSLVKFHFSQSSNCNWLLPMCRNTKINDLSMSKTKIAEGHTFKPLSLSNSTVMPTFLHPFNQSLVTGGSRLSEKSVNVFSPNISVDTDIDFLDAYDDEYDGVIIDPDRLPSSANAFSTILQSSLSQWKLKGKKGVWLKILENQADLVPIAIREGFAYHHAEPGYVMLIYWLPDGPCLLPATGSHQVGIGAFVMNDKKEVLAVKERKCPLRCSGVWKLPTGFVDKSEDIYLGAIREVKEETGIDTEFVEVVAFRHAHFVSFEKSDLFFVCMLKPLSSQINIGDALEIEEAKWIPVDEFVSQPFYQEDLMSRKAIDICIARHERQYSGFSAHQLMSKFDDRISYLYYSEY